MTNQDVIVLEIDDLNELFPSDPNSPGVGPRPGMMAPDLVTRPGGNAAHSAIQIVSTRGQNLFAQTSIDWDAGRVTLRTPLILQAGEPREVRISGTIRASTRIAFEFHDLPMP